MTASEKEQTKATGGGAMANIKGFLILVLLLVGAGAGGYFFGTQQQFAPVRKSQSPDGAATSTLSSTTSTQSTTQSQGTQSTQTTSYNLKNKYWIQAQGDDHVGYAISVKVNDQLADKFFSPGKKTEITRLVKPGENQISFEAKLLPEGMREHAGMSNYELKLRVMSGPSVDATQDTTELLNYSRNAAENKDFNDSMSFVTLE